MKRGSRNEGVALMLVLILLAASVILGVAYLSQASLNATMAAGHAGGARARYLAESGVQHGICLLRENPDALVGSDANPLGPYTVESGDDGETYTISVASAGGDEYTVRSVGTSGRGVQTVTATVSLGGNYAAMIEAADPFGYWRLDESGGRTAVDAAGRNDGLYVNGVELGLPGAVSGDRSAAARFDGSNDYIHIVSPNPSGVDVSGQGMAIVAWIRADAAIYREAAILSKASGQALADQHWSLGVTRMDRSGLRLRFALKGRGATVASDARVDGDFLGQWVHVAVSYDRTEMRTYVNGIPVATMAATGAITKDKRVAVWIGGCPTDAHGKPWDGLLDEVALFDRSLSGAQVMELAAARSSKVAIVEWEN